MKRNCLILFSELFGGIKLNKKLSCILLVVFLFVPFVFGAEVSEITEPLNKIYDLVKGVISVVAVLVIAFAGVQLMFF